MGPLPLDVREAVRRRRRVGLERAGGSSASARRSAWSSRARGASRALPARRAAPRLGRPGSTPRGPPGAAGPRAWPAAATRPASAPAARGGAARGPRRTISSRQARRMRCRSSPARRRASSKARSARRTPLPEPPSAHVEQQSVRDARDCPAAGSSAIASSSSVVARVEEVLELAFILQRVEMRHQPPKVRLQRGPRAAAGRRRFLARTAAQRGRRATARARCSGAP